MPAPRNEFKAALAAGHLQRGLWLALGSETVTEIVGQAGFDWCLVDGEHGPWDPSLIRRQLMVLQGTGTPSVVRVPAAETWIIKQALDLGAQSIMVPMVQTADAAAAVVRACRYPPDGVRGNGGYTMRASGYGAIPDYIGNANDEICIIVQVESRAALSEIDAITAIDGVDCVFIGPADLAAEMGYADTPMAPEFWAEIREAVARIVAGGKAAGIFGPPAMNDAMIEAGVTMLSLSSDAATISGAIRALAHDTA